MKSKNIVSFDKLDHKCFDELPLLVDVLSSTLNKIGSLISFYHDDLLKIVKKEVRAQHGWRVKQDYNLTYYPLSHGSKRKINLLQSRMEAFDEIEIIKKHGYNVKNTFWIYMGLWCDDTHEPNHKNIYYSINRDAYFVRKYGILYSKKFYDNLAKKVKDLNSDVWHPDDEGDYEEIYLWCDELDTDKLNEYYERFKTNIVIPYIKNLE